MSRRAFYRLSAFAAAALVVSAACSGGESRSTGPGDPVPELMVAVETLPPLVQTGQQAARPLRVRITDSSGVPVPHIQVSWRVLEGDAAMTAFESYTDDAGIASSRPIYGDSAGTVRIRATAPGVLPVVFQTRSGLLARTWAELDGGAMGLARLSSGELLVSEHYLARVERIGAAEPRTPVLVASGITVSMPWIMAADRDRAYVATYAPSGLTILDLTNNRIDTSIAIPNGGVSLALAPGGDRVYVSSYMGSVYRVDLATRKLAATLPVAGQPWGFAFHATEADTLMYVTTRGAGSVAEIDARTDSIRRYLPAGTEPWGLAISPDGAELYVADLARGRVRILSVASGTTRADIPTPGQPCYVAITPDGATLYVGTWSGDIYVIDVETRRIAKHYLTDRGQLWQIAVSADGDSAWVADEAGRIDLVTR